MFKNNKEFCKFFTLLFEQIEKGIKPASIEIEGYTEEFINEAIYQCVQNEYITSVDAYRDSFGVPHITPIVKMHVTFAGYQFLNSLRSDTALEKANKADIKGWIALVISGITLLIYFIEQYQAIVNFKF